MSQPIRIEFASAFVPEPWMPPAMPEDYYDKWLSLRKLEQRAWGLYQRDKTRFTHWQEAHLALCAHENAHGGAR